MTQNTALTQRAIVAVWWPLAASWLLMAAEQPAVAAVIARLDKPQLHLAAYGSVVLPLALVIEAPIIMLLAASTELSRDRPSYRELSRFTHSAGALLTALHLLLALTPAFDTVVRGVLAAPEAVAAEARVGMLLLLPWTWSIAWRRMGQGVLIRFGRSKAVGIGTAIRLCTTGVALTVAYALDAPGIVAGTSAISIGVIGEALYVAALIRPVVRQLPAGDPSNPPLRGRAFWAFYLPLMSMPMVTLLIQPIGTAAVARMPGVIGSLAVWPVVTSFLFVMQAVGLAFNEVVVALLDRLESRRALWRFTVLLSLAVTIAIAALAFTPLSNLWFGSVMGLPAELVQLATLGLIIGVPIPACRVLQSWYQGVLVNARKTLAVSEAVVVFALVGAGTFVVGVINGNHPGLVFAVCGYALGRVAQTLWLWARSRGVLRQGPPLTTP